MKNKLFYLIGVAILLCYVGTFTSCVNGVDDEYLDQKISGGETDKGEEGDIPDINGEFSADGDYELKMTYNGEEIGGKKVIVMADEDFATATFTLAGTMKDLSALSGLLEGMNATFTTYSPIPGEKEYLLKNVKLYRSGSDFRFDGEDIQPTHLVTYKGKILDDVMTIDITHMYTREENDLLGAWKLGAVKEIPNTTSGQITLISNTDKDPSRSAPLFLDWASDAKVYMGDVATGIDFLPTITIDRPMNGIFNLLMSEMVSAQLMSGLAGTSSTIEQLITKLLEYVVAEETGGMYASYSYAPIGDAPIYSQDMSHNIIRYYFDKDNKLRIEANADYLLSSLGGLLGGATRSTTRSLEDTKILGKELVDKLRPALEQGFPCEYTISGDNMTINIEGKFLLDVMRTLSELLRDESTLEFLGPTIDGIGAYAPNVKNLLKNMKNALGDDCTGIKLGFHMVRTTPSAAN